MVRFIKILLLILGLAPGLIFAKTIIHYRINGINGDLLTNVKTVLSSAEKDLLAKQPNLAQDDLLQFYYSNDAIIKQALQPYGYFSPQITQTYKQLDRNEWRLVYNIDPGPPIQIAEIQIDITGAGNSDSQFLKWKQDFPLKVGGIFNNQTYNDGKQSFFALANNMGYIRARIAEHTVRIDLNSYTATIHLHYITGKQFFVGPITFSTSPLNTDFLRRYLTIKENDIYSIPKLLVSQQNLANSGYFSDVTVKHSPIKKNQQIIPLDIELTPLKKMQYILGAGYGTDTGYRAQAGWNWRLINAFGQSLETSYNISQIGNSFNTTYFIPGYDPVNDKYSISANIANYTTDAGTTNLQNYGVAYLQNQGKWQNSYGVSYQFENYSLTNQPGQYAQLLLPSATWTYINTDNAVRPTYGERVSLTVQGSNELALSTVSFLQILLRTRAILPINYYNRFFIRADLGTTYTNNFSAIPLSLQFTAGGTQSVRGYGYQSLGPGEDLFDASAEYQYRVIGDWFAAYFQDVGNAFTGLAASNLQRSQGVGVVWQSPIGTMELDYARSISIPNSGGLVEFNLGGLL